MIYLRDDDVLVRSGSWRSPVERFQRVHRWTLEAHGKLLHVPTLVVEELKAYPECVEYIRDETADGRMAPELHGMWHARYHEMPAEDVAQHLEEGYEWMTRVIQRSPRFWYTPWGADNEVLRHLAREAGMELRGANRKMTLASITGQLRGGTITVDDLDEQEVLMHWWEGGSRALRLAKAIHHGTWEAAAAADKELFGA